MLHTYIRTTAAAATIGGVIMVLSGCTSTPPQDDHSSSRTAESAHPMSTSASQKATSTVAANPSDYATDRGTFEWSMPGTSYHSCTVIAAGAGGRGVWCTAKFPSDTPPVTVQPFGTQIPDTVAMTHAGISYTLSEGGPATDPLLPSGASITVDDITCIGLDDGVQCRQGNNSFRIGDGTVSTSGTRITAQPTVSNDTTSPATAPAGEGLYTEGTAPVAPGTSCGAATGDLVVEVRTGSISCTEALTVMKGYLALPPGDFGNNIREYQGWQCASPTAARSAELGYSSQCIKDGTEIVRPQ